ncbi:Chemotaxis protein [Gammaproteobacteria bacterium]
MEISEISETAETSTGGPRGLGPSSAHAPDLDWSQVRETVRMLHLAVVQIEMAMREGDDSINALTHSFTTMIGCVNAMNGAVANIHPNDENMDLKSIIEENCGRVNERMRGAVVAFQFYDKLSQRLGHVSHSLSALAELVSDSHRLFNPREWKGLQEMIRSKYAMRFEQEMFDNLLAGMSVYESLKRVESRQREVPMAEDDIELF